MTRTDIEQEYFEWMYDIITRNRYSGETSFRKLLLYLHEKEYQYIIPKDANRAEDGEDLRKRFAYDIYNPDSRDIVVDYLSRPCSFLEMLIALSIRIEDIMDDTRLGDRTGQWFWGMIATLGLGDMYDLRYDEKHVDDILERFLDHEYEPNGRGGLFYIRNCEYDLRDIEIWTSALWYLDTIT